MGSVLFWGASYLGTAVAYETISPQQLGLVRYETISPQQLGLVRAVLAGVLFFVFRALTGQHEQVARSDWPRLVVSGLFGVTL